MDTLTRWLINNDFNFINKPNGTGLNQWIISLDDSDIIVTQDKIFKSKLNLEHHSMEQNFCGMIQIINYILQIKRKEKEKQTSLF